MTHHLLNVGSIKCYVLSDGDEVAPKSEITGLFAESPAIDAAVEAWTGSTTFSMNCLLIETDGQRILIDVGMGTLDASHNAQLPTRLQELGVTPGQITMVVLTHGHGDHIGGVVTDEGQRCALPPKNACCRSKTRSKRLNRIPPWRQACVPSRRWGIPPVISASYWNLAGRN